VTGLKTRQRTYRLVGDIIDKELQRWGEQPQNAWKAIYSALLWYEPVGGGVSLPHIIDSDKLRPQDSVWRQRAQQVNNYLATAFGCTSHELPKHVDKLMENPDYRGLQRQNPLGAGLIGALAHVLTKFGDTTLKHQKEVIANTLFPNIRIPGRSRTAKIDIASMRGDYLVAITSCKWSLRHDRIGDISVECPAYKQAALDSLGRRIKFFVVTNEFDPSRLLKVLANECIDAVVHIHKPLVTQVSGLDNRLQGLWDLTDYIHSTREW